MKIYGLCGGCRQKKMFVKKAEHKHPRVGILTSKSDMCGPCRKKLLKMIQP